MFYINAFVWRKGVSQFLSPLTILEGIVLDYNLHFQVIFGEYAHTYESTTNTAKSRTVGAIALGPTGNLQGGVRFFSLVSGKILQRAKKDYTLLKMPEDAIRRLLTMGNNSVAGLLFGDRHNIDLDNSTEITGVDDDVGDHNINQEHPYDVQVDQQQEEDDPPQLLQDPTPLDTHLDAVTTITDDNSDEDLQHTGVVVVDDQSTGVTPDNAEDEIEPPEIESTIEPTVVDSDKEEEEQVYTTRSNRISRPFDKEKEYPAIYYSENNTQSTNKDNIYTSSYYANEKIPKGRCLRLYYTDDNYEQHLTDGDYYNNQFFIENVNETISSTTEIKEEN